MAVREFEVPGAMWEAVESRLAQLFAVSHPSLVDYVAVEQEKRQDGGVKLSLMTEWMAEPSVRETTRHFGALPEHIARGHTTHLLSARGHLGEAGLPQHGRLRSACIHIDKRGLARIRDHGLYDMMTRGVQGGSWEGRRAESDSHGLGRVVFEFLTGGPFSTV